MAAKQMGTLGNPFAQDKAPKKGPKILHELTTSRAADGGIHFEHRFAGYDHQPEHHEKATGHAAVKHFMKHMGIEGVSVNGGAAGNPEEKGESKAEEMAEGPAGEAAEGEE